MTLVSTRIRLYVFAGRIRHCSSGEIVKSCVSLSAMEVEEGELVEGIEANDVGTLLEQFLKYEEKQGSQDPASSVSLLMDGTSCLPQDLVSQRTNCNKEIMDSSFSILKDATTNSSKEFENLSHPESSENKQLHGDLNSKNRKKDEQRNRVDNHATDHNYACSGFPLRKAPLIDSVKDGCGTKSLSRSSSSRSPTLDLEKPCKKVLVREGEPTHHNERQHCENEDKRSRIPKRYRGRYCEDSTDDESSFEDDNYNRRYSSDPDRQKQGRKRVRKGTYSSDEENFYKIKKRRHSMSSDERNYSSSDENDKDECRCDPRRSTSNVSYHRYSNDSERDSSRRNQRKERSNSQEQSRWDTRGRKDKKCHDVELERKMGFKFDQNIKCTGKEERRIVYVGKISNKTTKDDVWRRFRPFGPIEKITVHFRDDGDNYAFVTFFEYSSAAEAIERGNEDPDLEVLDICFGGRRKFCGGSYVDFDSNTSCLEEGEVSRPPSSDEMDFDALLRLSQRTLKSRKESSFKGR